MAGQKLREETYNEYIDFIKDNIQLLEVATDQIEVNSPFVDSDGENISFSVYRDNDSYLISDDGFTAWELNLNGIDISKEGNRKTLFDSNIKYNGFNYENNKIEKRVNKEALGQVIHDMTQLLINLYDINYLHRDTIANQFYLDVNEYFAKNKDIYKYMPEIKLMGKSQLDHKFDYVFTTSSSMKLTRVEQDMNKNKLDSILISWLDTVEYRREKYRGQEDFCVLLSGDAYGKLKDDFKLALDEYEIGVINFDDKAMVKDELALAS